MRPILISMPAEADLLPALRRYWGYDSFRPMQEKIVRSLLAGHDTCVVMPTGGGKSLCYQLPALVLGKTAIVISPLIALMQDQAAQLAQMGIPAAVLNSMMPPGEQSRVMVKARGGEYRLLYLSPERLAREETMKWLRNVPTSFFAIDEAHCISEWGHEFRPEYRQLSRFRTAFPELPIAAFTASATRRVRSDILHQLQLRDPQKFIASFHRRNLRYLVKHCEWGTQSDALMTALRSHAGENVIVYAPTIARVEETVDFLEEQGIPAVAYHGKMESALRRKNQERWMSDEVRVLVGTIAFGLGINKANVRAVIHLSLPKSVEQYYQEAGRAGRDGLPADCLLLWQDRDTALLAYFNNQISDANEKQRAWQRYREIRSFVESAHCRHRQICVHFGEVPKWTTCGACDVCGPTPEWLTEPAQEPAAPARAREYSLPLESHSAPAAGDIDLELRDYLREWRRLAAQKQGIGAFVIMHDTTMEEVCRKRPASIADLLRITGIGQRKAEMYGKEILQALERFRQGARAKAPTLAVSQPARETRKLLAAGNSLAEVAAIRGRQPGSVATMAAQLVEQGQLEFQASWLSVEKRSRIEAACAQHGLDRLRPIKDALPEDISFDEIKLVVGHLRRQKSNQAPASKTG